LTNNNVLFNMCTNYWTEVRYLVEHYTVYREKECPEDHIICCENYFLIHGHCFRIYFKLFIFI
jgi:hypothetical protein